MTLKMLLSIKRRMTGKTTRLLKRKLISHYTQTTRRENGI
jgi:hypothetical protein